MFIRTHHRFQNPADPAAGGGGGPDITPELQAIIDARVNDAVSGLKAKNGELIGKLKDSSENLKRYDGIDPDAVRTILSKFASDEEATLLKAGKIDEVLAKRTERMQADHAKAIEKLQEKNKRESAKASKLAARTLSGAIKDAAIKAGALPEAMEDIVLRGGGLWKLNDDGDPVALNGDEVVFGKDGKTPLTPSEWAESLRETAPHLWPKAQGSNALGSGFSNKSQPAGDFGGSKAERQNAIAKKFNLPKG